MATRIVFWTSKHFDLARILDIITSREGTVEYSHTKNTKPNASGSTYLCWAIPSQNSEAIREQLSRAPTEFLEVLEADQLIFPITDFRLQHVELTPEVLRVKESVPTINHNSVVYRFDSDETRDQIYRVFDEFQRNPDWTHFVCFPIAPNFPDFTRALATLLSSWNVRPSAFSDIPKFHLTLALFVLKSENDVAKMISVTHESLMQTEWPDNRMLAFTSLETFGQAQSARILHAKPEGELTGALEQFVVKLSENARSAGFTRMSLGTPLHGTILRPGHVSGGHPRTFDARPIIAQFDPALLPPIQASEVRLVQRFRSDEDGFYHTVARFSIGGHSDGQ
jgi:hypothetical protein